MVDLDSYLSNAKQEDGLKIFRYYPQASRDTFDGKNTLDNGERLSRNQYKSYVIDVLLHIDQLDKTYRSKGGHYVIVTKESRPRPANQQTRREEDQAQCHRKRSSNCDQSTAVSRVDHSAQPYVVTAVDHGGGGFAWVQEGDQ